MVSLVTSIIPLYQRVDWPLDKVCVDHDRIIKSLVFYPRDFVHEVQCSGILSRQGNCAIALWFY
jgi:hypothetical protein